MEQFDAQGNTQEDVKHPKENENFFVQNVQTYQALSVVGLSWSRSSISFVDTGCQLRENFFHWVNCGIERFSIMNVVVDDIGPIRAEFEMEKKIRKYPHDGQCHPI